MSLFVGWVTACIPHHDCHRYIRRAVDSLLGQSYPWIRVIVINDGDPLPPWGELKSITDPRLFKFNLRQSAGPYFCQEIARRATPDAYFLIQDADDWSSPRRVEALLSALNRDQSDLAVSAEPQVIENGNGARIVDVRWLHASREHDAGNFIVHQRITPSYKYRAPHHGLFRRSSLDAIGGYYGGLRISYDTLIPNLILMIGRISHVPEPLYYRLLRPSSLTHSSVTGVGSKSANYESAIQRDLYRKCFFYYQLFLMKQLTASQLAAAIRAVCAAQIPPSHQRALTTQTRRLVKALRSQGT